MSANAGSSSATDSEGKLTVEWLKNAKIDPATGRTAVESLLEYPDETTRLLNLQSANLTKPDAVSRPFLAAGMESYDILNEADWSQFTVHADSFLSRERKKPGHWYTDLTEHFCSELEKQACTSLEYDEKRTQAVCDLLSGEPTERKDRISLDKHTQELIYTNPLPSKEVFFHALLKTSSKADDWESLGIRPECYTRLDNAASKIQEEKDEFNLYQDWTLESQGLTFGSP